MRDRSEDPSGDLLIAIGASAGGLQPIRRILGLMPTSFQASVVVATHRDPEGQENDLARILAGDTRLEVREPIDGEQLRCQTLYVGSPSERLRLSNGAFHVAQVTSQLHRLQRIDELFTSVAQYAKEQAVGVVLSGTMWDGTQGLQAIDRAGGKCIVQEPCDATFRDMPEHALKNVDVDFVGSAEEIASVLMELAVGRKCG